MGDVPSPLFKTGNVQVSPRLSLRLLDAIERFAARKIPIAEINRLVGAEAERLGVARPSYERVRQLVHEARRFRGRHPSASRILLGIATRARSPAALAELAIRPPRDRLRDQRAK